MTPLLETPAAPTMTSPPEDACAAALGNFGLWQIRACFLIALVKIPSAWHMASILFTAPTPDPEDFWCARTQDFAGGNYSRSTLEEHGKVLDPCVNYEAAQNALTTSISDRKRHAPALDDIAPTCVQFEFNTTLGNYHSVVTELVCDRAVLVSVSQFFYLLGILVGGFICTKLLAKFSPRNLLLAGVIVQILAGVGCAYCAQFELQVTLRFVSAVACAHMFTSGYMLCSDICGGWPRLVIVSCYEHFWSFGVILLPCLASLFSDCRYLQLWISIPTILVLMFSRWIPESPRWLLRMGRYAEGKKVLEQGARVNGRAMPIMEAPTPADKSKPPDARWLDMFSSSSNGWTCAALHVAWAATVVTYYGALLNVKNLGGDVFFNTGMAGVAEIAGVLLGLLLILWNVKKWLILGLILQVGGVACLLCWTVPQPGGDVSARIMLALAMIGRVAIASSLTLLQVTSSELLPPALRQVGIVSSVTFARVWLLSAPFIGSLSMYGNNVSLSAFGLITIVGGSATLFIAVAEPNLPTKSTGAAEERNDQSIWTIDRQIATRSNLEMVETKEYIKYDKDVI